MKKQKAFTLIELLVVIAIIGLLSSVVLVSVSTARDRARIASGLQFMSNLDHSLMPVGVWHLDGDADDSSGYGNDGTLQGDAHIENNESLCMQGKCLSLDGSDDYIEISDSTSLSPTNEITVSAWVKFDSFSDDAVLVLKSGSYFLWSDTDGSLGGRVVTVDDGIQNVISSAGDLKTGTWHNTAFTRSSNKMKLYIDGKEVNSRNDADATDIDDTDADIRFGYYAAVGGTDGFIDEVRIYDESLTAGQIGKIYAQTKDKYYAQKK